MTPSHRKKVCGRCSPMHINLHVCLFLCSNVCTGMVVFFGFYCSTQLTNTVSTEKVGRQLLVDLDQSNGLTPAPQLGANASPFLAPPPVSMPPPTSVVKIVSSTVVYHSFSKTELLHDGYLTSDHHSDLLCKVLQHQKVKAAAVSPSPNSKPAPRTSPSDHTNHTLNLSPSNSSSHLSSKASDKASAGPLKRVSRDASVLNNTSPSNHSTFSKRTSLSHTSSHNSSLSRTLNHTSLKPSPSSHSANSSPSPAKPIVSGKPSPEYVPYIIGITPTYYRMTQRLDLTSLCQTLMNVPRLLWIVVEDSNTTSSQVKDLLSHCRVESVLLHAETTEKTRKAKQRGVDQRNLAMDWIRDRCKGCDGRGTCEGVVYFMDDDNTFDIRLFEKIRWTRGVSVFPVGFVAGLKFEGPVCKDGKVERWQVQYAPKRHIPVDMAAFAFNVKMLTSKPKVKMGFKPDGVKRSTPGYLEPDFLKSLGAKRDTVECRGSSDEILVWHVKSTYKSLVYEKKHPSDPKVKV